MQTEDTRRFLRDPWRLAAITVTYNPSLSDGILQRQIESLRDKVTVHVIVDNGSRNLNDIRHLVEKNPKIESCKIIPLDRNYGIGFAMNVGVRAIAEMGDADWILFLDQDSYPATNAFLELQREVDEFSPGQDTAVIALNPNRRRLSKVAYQNSIGKPMYAKLAMTSGMIARVDVLTAFPFDTSLFMYYVDSDFCRQLGRAGYKVLWLSRAVLNHHEGEVKIWGNVEWFCVPPERLFYIARNSFLLFRRYHFVEDFFYSLYVFLMNVAAGNRPFRSLQMYAKGVVAGLAGGISHSSSSNGENPIPSGMSIPKPPVAEFSVGGTRSQR